jgi:hypothetical protein
MHVICVQCPNCKDVIFSRTTHDFNFCTCKKTGIDGGNSYVRISAEDLSKVQRIQVNLPDVNEFVLFRDWNNRFNHFGNISKQKPTPKFIWIKYSKAIYPPTRKYNITFYLSREKARKDKKIQGKILQVPFNKNYEEIELYIGLNDQKFVKELNNKINELNTLQNKPKSGGIINSPSDHVVFDARPNKF